MTSFVDQMPTRPPCPPWCRHDYGAGIEGAPLEEHARLHRGPRLRLPYADPASPHLLREAVVELNRFDDGGGVGAVEVKVGAVDTNGEGECVFGGLHPDNPLSLDDTERLAYLLLRVVEFGRTDQRTE
jgi:hypothetical protein